MRITLEEEEMLRGEGVMKANDIMLCLSKEVGGRRRYWDVEGKRRPWGREIKCGIEL